MPRAGYNDAVAGFDRFFKDQGRQILGRDLSDQERASILAQTVPLYQDEWYGLDKGNQAAATALQGLYQADQSPDKLRKAAEGKAGNFSPQVQQLFQSSLGRAPTAEESQHFGTLLATGNLDAYQLGQFLTQTPESQNAKDKSFRSDLTGELQTQDEGYYKNKILPAITQQFAQQGRSTDSSAYAAMLAKAAQEQNTNREGFLSNLSASQYGANKSAASADYGKLLDQYYGGQNYNTQRAGQMSDAYTKRLTDLQDYQMQQQTYDRYLRSMGKRGGGVAGGISGFMSGGATGGTIGSKFGPWGAVIGGLAGGGLGAYGGSQSQGG